MARGTVDTVRAALQEYASRGVFKSFSEVRGRGRNAEFRFLWFHDVAFRIEFDPRTRTLTFRDLLPAAPYGSEIDRDVRTFIRGRSSRALPEHRRIDSRRLQVKCVNRAGCISVVIRIKAKDLEYGVRKSVHLIHDVLMDFLNQGRFVQYLVDHFKLDLEMAL
jgi:hypothetical protein